MARRLKLKLRTPLARSFVVHLVLVGMITMAVLFEPKVSENIPIELESISLEKQVKRTFHKAIHSIGIPHHEPDDDVISSQKPIEKTQSSTSDSDQVSSDEGGGIAPTEMQKYIIEIVNRINRNKRYPKDAQFNEQEGVVEILLEVFPDGKIARSEISKKTPFESLNQAALAAVQKLGALPPLPVGANGNPVLKPITLHIPIHFQLK